ncbi:MAG: hypothetical protein AB1796_13090 [Bacillota bacterium]
MLKYMHVPGALETGSRGMRANPGGTPPSGAPRGSPGAMWKGAF